jgi:hypothetical protein
MPFRLIRTLIGVAAFIVVAISHGASTQVTYSVDAHVLSAGASSRSGNACFRMNATLAEPVAGFSSSAAYSLSGGFLATLATPTGDDIFFNGFEDCSP